jgi:hypothetical protein
MPESRNLAGLFAGTLYLSELDPDTQTYGDFFTVETDKCEITAASDLLEAISKSRENYGQAHTSYAKAKPTEIAFNFTEENKAIIAAKLSGIVADLTRAATTLTSHPVTLGALGGWVEIGTKYLGEATITVRESADATDAYAAGTDYEINPRLGLIRPLKDGTIAAKAIVYVSASVPALAGTQIKGAARYSHEYRGYLDGLDLARNEDVIVNMPRIIVSSTDAKDFLDEKLSSTALAGRLMIPADGGRPFTVDYPG